MAEPGKLVDLALDALGKYIFLLYNRQKSVTEAEVTSNHIHHKIIEYIPAILADKVTNGLLHIFDHLITEGKSCQPAAVCDLFIKSILHPAVTQIKPIENVQNIPGVLYTHGLCIYSYGISVMKTIHLFSNLRIISILNVYEVCEENEITFPEQLAEFTGLGSDALIAKLAEQCKCLKVLNVHRSSSVTCNSVESLLQMKHLEKLNISQTWISIEGITKFLNNYIMNFEEPHKLRCLMSSSISEEHLDTIAKKLPNLKVIICKSCIDSISSNFQNVIGVDIRITFPHLKLLLQKVGKQLIYLSVEIEYNEFDDEEVEISEIIAIGQNCTCLKSFSMSWSIDRFPVFIDTVKNPLPGFQTISNLEIHIGWSSWNFYALENTANIVKFLLFHSSNVKILVLPIDSCVYSKYNLVMGIVGKEYMQNVEEVHFSLCCCRDCMEYCYYGFNGFDTKRDNEIVQLLIDNCPNFRFIGGIPGVFKNHGHNTQKLKFCSHLFYKMPD